uniref:Adenylate cyclase putative n=1 Tax=Albugo laibachii Nc14 TaxID=890382 RepID=F0WKU8_9STRA|nr:adenylate cyclase putative [Albugo laibachii Nc14]|eukprot:CCA21905.1 adenylate cyclase putative [Albugo laibachii Nc14]
MHSDVTHSSSSSADYFKNDLDMRLTAYLPAVVRRFLEQQRDTDTLPFTHSTTVVAMFADVSGFTAMTESLAERGPVGAEVLGKHLNSYFEQMLRLISSAGGDVFKFAGDAMLIFWHENKEDTFQNLLRRCLQCALRVQSHLHQAELAPGVVLSVKMGIGFGNATIAHLGGISDGCTSRLEYIAVGPALEQAFRAEHDAAPGDVICSSECWVLVHTFFQGNIHVGSSSAEGSSSTSSFHFRQEKKASITSIQLQSADDAVLSEKLYRIQAVKVPIRVNSRRVSFTRNDCKLYDRMKQYVSRSVWPYINALDEFWGSEVRDVTVAFINLGFSEQDLSKVMDQEVIQRLQDAFALVQDAIFEYEGTINKFLVDDKGSTVIAAFGLPPVSHENDPIRAILASLKTCGSLGVVGLKASIGLTSGAALCGVVGHQGNRREYTVLGDIVNLSARLMQRAKSERGGVITDEATKILAEDVLHFEQRPEIMVKGKHDSIKIHRPYPRMSILMGYHLHVASKRSWIASDATGQAQRTKPMANVMMSMHLVQVRDAKRWYSLQGRVGKTLPSDIIESECFLQHTKAILDQCGALSRSTRSGAIILQGDIGVGKTILTRNVLSKLFSCQILSATASAFAIQKPYAIWVDLLKAYVEQEAQPLPNANNKRSDTVEKPQGRTPSTNQGLVSCRSQRVRRRFHFSPPKPRKQSAPTLTKSSIAMEKRTDQETEGVPGNTFDFGTCLSQKVAHLIAPNKLTEVACKLNELLEPKMTHRSDQFEDIAVRGIFDSFEETFEWFFSMLENELRASETANDNQLHSNEFKNEEGRQVDEMGLLLLCVLHAISRDRPVLLCLDDAMYIDPLSWKLVPIVVNYFTNCLTLLVTRPPSSTSTDPTQSSSFAIHLNRLGDCKRFPGTTINRLRLLALNSQRTEALAMKILQVDLLPEELGALLLYRSQGNPLFLSEIIREMRQRQAIRVNEKRRTCVLHLQTPWDDKNNTSSCFHCHSELHTSKEKHRCKCCGYVFCVTCTPKACRKKLLGSTGDPVRHCRNCYTLTSTRRASSGSDASLHQNFSSFHVRSHRPRSKMRAALRRTKETDSSGTLSRKHSFSQLSGISLTTKTPRQVAVQPPYKIKSVLTTLLDQLTVSQRMIMKTASVIGEAFDRELLRASCPIKAHLARFTEDLDTLERLWMIRKIEVFVGGVPRSTVGSSSTSESDRANDSTTRLEERLKVKYEFTHGFIQEVLVSQMLCSQLDKLSSRITDAREQKEKELRHIFFEKSKGALGKASLSAGDRPEGNRRIPLPLGIFPVEVEEVSNEENNGSDEGVLSRLRPEISLTEDEEVSSSNYLSQSYSSRSLATNETEDTTFARLKTGCVYVRKHSSVFSHFKWKGLGNGRLWKRRFAVLNSTLLVLYSDRNDKSGTINALPKPCKPKKERNPESSLEISATGSNNSALESIMEREFTKERKESVSTMAGSRRCRLLHLKHAKVNYCDPDAVYKVNCFQLQVQEWTKGKQLMKQNRSFLIGVPNESDLDGWLYMIKYAIESLT